MIARSLLAQTAAHEVRIFYSYARRDESWRQEVDRLLPEFEWDVAVRTWYDGEIEPGTEWASEINRNLAAADVILLFVGQAFVDSRYCREVELPVALRRHARGEARVVPLILEETDPDWRTLEFAHLQVLPRNGVPISSWQDRGRALRNVVQGLVDLVVHQGLHHDGRMRWELHLEGTVAEFTNADRLTATTELRSITADKTLRIVGVGPESVVLTIESAQDALAYTEHAFEEGALTGIAGRQICRIVRLFGSGVRASSTIVGFERPDPLPDVDQMLLPSRACIPVLLRGMEFIEFNDVDPLSFTWIVDTGHSGLKGDRLQAETRKLMDYFLTALAVREEDIFVNLEPDENAKLLPGSLHDTLLGLALLESDYRLKRLSASLLHPDLESGRNFWQAVIARCHTELGADDVPLVAFQRVWLVPETAEILETTRESFFRHLNLGPPQGNANEKPFALVVDARFKIMTEREYFAGRSVTEREDLVARICDEVFRDIVLPVVQREVDEGESFAETRQVYNSIILATWFKKRYRKYPRIAKYFESGRPAQLGIIPQDMTNWRFDRGQSTVSACISASEPESHRPLEPEALRQVATDRTDQLEAELEGPKRLRQRGELDASRKLLESIVSRRRTELGQDHPATITAFDQLGRTLRQMGSVDSAVEIHEEVLRLRRAAYGDAHDMTCNAMEVLAASLTSRGDVVRARELTTAATVNRVRASPSYQIRENREYFERYLDIFESGVFYLERDELVEGTAQKRVRAYLAGCIDLRQLSAVLEHWIFGS